MTDVPVLLTPAELAVALGLGGGVNSHRKVLEWRRAYDWPHVKLGKAVRFTAEQAAAIVALHTREPGAGAGAGLAGVTTLPGQTDRSSRGRGRP